MSYRRRMAFVATVTGERSDSPTLVRLNDGVTPGEFARCVLGRFRDAGYLIHIGTYAEVSSAGQAASVEKLLIAGHAEQAQAHLPGPTGRFFGPLWHVGLRQEAIITQPRGNYVLACVMPTQDGRDHSELGLMRTLRVVR